MSPDTNDPRPAAEQENEKKAPPVTDLPPRDASDANAEQTRGGSAPVDGFANLKK